MLCTRCGADKAPDEFYDHPLKKNGKASRCKPCHAEDCRRALLRRRYGIPDDQVESVLAAQRAGGPCQICGTDGELHIDHDESRGYRGLLCGRCNRGIGMFKHDPARIEQAITYLERHASPA